MKRNYLFIPFFILSFIFSQSTVLTMQSGTVDAGGTISIGVELTNPDEYISEINAKGKIELELRIGIGKGYVPSEENELPNAPIGTLAIDSIFNPVTKVTFNVQPVPGAKDPIEILSIEVETDGSVTPQDAISQSATV